MANNFQIIITATDKVTATVAKINASMARITAPIRGIQKSAAALGKEMGFDKLGKALANVGKSAAALGGQLSSIAAPLALIVGGGSLAGVAAMATEWARLGSEVSRTARSLDMSTSSLQAFRGAGQAAGVSSQELTGGLKNLGDTMEDALYGRNQQALVMLNRLNVGVYKTASGSIDAARGMKDLSRAIAGIKNVQAQGLVARTFGLEAVLPLLRQGPKAIEAYERKVIELGGVMDGKAVSAAENFGVALNYLHIATQGVRNTIGEKLLPILQPLVERFTAWMAVNRGLIATRIGEFVEGLAHWLEQLDFNKISNDIAEFGRSVGKAVDFMGGWKNAAIALVVVLNAGLIASVINLGLAIGGLTTAGIPVLIRGFGLLAAAMEASLVPAILKGLLSVGLYVGGLAEAAAGIPLLGGLLSGLSTAFLAVGAAIAATPIGWLIAGISAIAFAVYAIYKNWGAIGDFFQKKMESVRAAFDKSWTGGIVKAILEFNPVRLLGDTMNGLSKWLFNFDLYAAGKNVIASLIRGVKAIAGMLPKSVLNLLGLSDLGVTETKAAQAAPTQSATAAAPAPTASPRQGPVGVRNNNPGNLREWGNMPRDSRGYAIFPTPEAGLSAMIRNLQVQQSKHGLNTISQIVSKWAPPSENNTAAYISDMARKTGFDPNQKLDLSDQRTVAPLISGIVKHEGNASGFSDEMINRAVAAQLAGGTGGQAGQAGSQKVEVALTLHGMPAGTSATAKTKGGGSPIRVASTMPTTVTP